MGGTAATKGTTMGARTAIGTFTAGLLLAGPIVAGIPAASAAAHPESLTLLSTLSAPVTSSTGQHLVMSLTAERFASDTSHADTNSPGSVSITLSTPKHTESHTWDFQLSGGSFTTESSGADTITTGSQISPYGAIDLKVQSGSAHQQSCGAGNYQVIHRAKLKGSVTFKTKSTGTHAWGTVTSKGLVFRHGTVTGSHGDDAEEACAGAFPCVAGISWQASHGGVTLSGSVAPGQRKGELGGDRFVQLSTPSGATRSDDISLNHQPLLLTKGKKPTLTFESAGPVARGASTITAKSHSPYRQSCKGGHLQKGRTYTGLYNIADVGLSLKAQIFGRIELSTVHDASFNTLHIV